MSYIVNLTGVQPTLVSGENIKTINGETILGSGDLTIDKTDVGLGNVDNTSDADKPISTATQTALDNKADLVGGKVPSSQIPAIAISEFLGAVNSQAAMLALLGQEGDWCIRTDVDLTYILIGTDPTDIDNWQEIVTPTGAVTSVNGYTGVVVLDQNDIGLGNVDDTSDLNKPISTATQTALNGKFNNPTGTSAQYIDGTGALQTFPTILDAGSLITEVYNNTGATLTKGTIVYINGGQGNLPTITKANASADATSAQTFGWVRNDITNNNNGYVIVAGKLSDLNTNGLGTGTQLYLSGTTSGAYTTTKPQAPIHLVYVGVVVRDHPTQGVIEVKIQNGYEVDELHDVQIASIANNQVLQYESSSQLWKNKSLTTASVAASTDKNYVTDAQQVVIGNTSGTNTGDETQATIQSKLGTASTSTSGYLTSTDWNTFNGKQNALTLTTTGTSGAATLVGSTLNIPNYASGTSGGRLGIADSTGTYTYYTTLTLAMAAATSGQTIEFFTDFTETTATAITLKNGVNINGNNHTYSYTAATGNCFIDNGVAVTCSILNLKISRTNYTSGSVYVQSSGSSDTNWNGSQIFVTASANNMIDILGTLRNCWVKVTGNGTAIYSAYTSNSRFFNCYGESTGSGTGLSCRTSTLYNCIGLSVSGNAIYGDQSNIYNSTFRTTSGVCAQYGTYQNCNAVSSSSFGFQQCTLYNCVGVSTSNAGINSGGYVIRNSTSISGVGVSGGEWYNCHIFTSLSPAVDVSMGVMNNCSIVTTWNNSLGHAVTTWYGPSGQYVNNYLQVANSSARIFNSTNVGALVYANNTMKGSASPISPNITQSVINTQDNQGNILL